MGRRWIHHHLVFGGYRVRFMIIIMMPDGEKRDTSAWRGETIVGRTQDPSMAPDVSTDLAVM